MSKSVVLINHLHVRAQRLLHGTRGMALAFTTVVMSFAGVAFRSYNEFKKTHHSDDTLMESAKKLF